VEVAALWLITGRKAPPHFTGLLCRLPRHLAH